MDHFPLLDMFEQADPALVAAEAHLIRKCTYLTRAVMAKVEGREPSLLLRFQVMQSLNACETAAQQIEQMLGNRSQMTADAT